MMADTQLAGPQLLLRAFRVEDADDVFEYASDPQVTRYAGWTRHFSPFDSLAYIQRCSADAWGPVTFAVEHREEQRVIGVVDIRVTKPIRRIGEIGYTLARRYWGRGLNVEAGQLLLQYGFESLRLRRIRAVSLIDNQRSLRTMEKLGMRHYRDVEYYSDIDGVVSMRRIYEIDKSTWRRRTGGGRYF